MTATEFYYLVQYFFVYAFLGWCTEVAFAAWKEHRFVNRGFLNGPICPVYGFGVAAVVQFLTPLKSSFILLYITSVILVTFIEWLTGFILEKVFHDKWWDYSDMPLNIQGYVCLPFSLIWGVACVFVVDCFHPIVAGLLKHVPFVIGIVILCILVAATITDLCVTASGILKLNKKLEKMQEIADELHQISDKLGEGIYKSTIAAAEKQEALKDVVAEKQEEFKESVAEKQEEFKESMAEKQEEISAALEDVSEEIKERIALLQKQYKDAKASVPRIQKRLLKAFPKMKRQNSMEALADLREKIKEKTTRRK